MNHLYLCKPVYQDGKLLHELNPLVLYMVKHEILPQPLIVICSDIEQRNRIRRFLRKYLPCQRMTFTWREVWKEKSALERSRLMELTDEGTYLFCSSDSPEVDCLYEDCDLYSILQ